MGFSSKCTFKYRSACIQVERGKKNFPYYRLILLDYTRVMEIGLIEGKGGCATLIGHFFTRNS